MFRSTGSGHERRLVFISVAVAAVILVIEASDTFDLRQSLADEPTNTPTYIETATAADTPETAYPTAIRIDVALTPVSVSTAATAFLTPWPSLTP
jgi:hypothetical protein